MKVLINTNIVLNLPEEQKEIELLKDYTFLLPEDLEESERDNYIKNWLFQNINLNYTVKNIE